MLERLQCPVCQRQIRGQGNLQRHVVDRHFFKAWDGYVQRTHYVCWCGCKIKGQNGIHAHIDAHGGILAHLAEVALEGK